jgi:hypothetical protein
MARNQLTKKQEQAAVQKPIYEQRAGEREKDAAAIIRRINSLLSDYDVMPDSFIMPELYQKYRMIGGKQVFVELEKAKKNKLITGWFTKAFNACRDAEELLETAMPERQVLSDEFMALLKKEDELAQEAVRVELQGKTVNDVVADEMARILKTAKRKAAFEYVDEKVNILRRIEALMRRLIDDLQALKYQQAA